MNFDSTIQDIKNRQLIIDSELKSLKESIADFVEAYEEARNFTEKFLSCCEKHGIDLVSIGVRTDKIQNCGTFPFECDGSVFAEGEDGGWPAIWSVVKEMKISGGAGNSNQYQISYKARMELVDGVYKLKDGVWEKIE